MCWLLHIHLHRWLCWKGVCLLQALLSHQPAQSELLLVASQLALMMIPLDLERLRLGLARGSVGGDASAPSDTALSWLWVPIPPVGPRGEARSGLTFTRGRWRADCEMG